MLNAEPLSLAGALFFKTTLLAAKWAGANRRKGLDSIATIPIDEKDKQIVFLRDRVEQLELQVSILRKHVGKHARSPRSSLAERLHVLWFMDYFQLPRRRVSHYFGIVRSTLYRWLHCIDDVALAAREAHNRTPAELAALIWEIAKSNPTWGRVRIAGQLALLGVFLAASTVRNILTRPRPSGAPEKLAAPPAQ